MDQNFFWDGNIFNWLHERGVATVSREFVEVADSPFDDLAAGPGAVGGLAFTQGLRLRIGG